MIHSIRIQNFKSLRDVTLRLQDVNLLIGPNNSGKSNVLKALEFLGDCIKPQKIGEPDYAILDLKRISYLQKSIDSDEIAIKFTVCFELSGKYYYYHLRLFDTRFVMNKNLITHASYLVKSTNFIDLNEFDTKLNIDKFEYLRFYGGNITSYLDFGNEKLTEDVSLRFHVEKSKGEGFKYLKYDREDAPATFINFNRIYKQEGEIREILYNLINIHPYNIQLSAFTGRADKQVNFIEHDASNLASFIDYLNNNNIELLSKIEKELKVCVGDFKNARAPVLYRDEKGEVRQIKLFDKNDLGFWADEVSEGTLYFLALLCIIFQPNPPNILMLEEPEKGIHPRRIHEVMEYIFQLAESKGIQVIMTSHSTQVVDRFKDLEEHIFVVNKPENETIIKNLWTEVIAEKNKKAAKKNLPLIESSGESLGQDWYAGLLDGVPQ